VRNKDTGYDLGKFGETLMLYEPLILLLPEAVPIEYAILGAIAVDVVRRILKQKTVEPAA